MKKNKFVLVGLTILAIVAGDCTPRTFTAPVQIHINPGDHIEQAAIAMDSHGISHIAGVVNNRIVYYRTRYGSPLVTLTMTMSSSGTNWKQYDPEIAVTDAGHAYITWIEQRGGTAKYACWRLLPFITDEPYTTTCNRLDPGEDTTGNVRVFSRGNTVYAVYDREYGSTGYIDSLWYKELTHPTTNVGKVNNLIMEGE